MNSELENVPNEPVEEQSPVVNLTELSAEQNLVEETIVEPEMKMPEPLAEPAMEVELPIVEEVTETFPEPSTEPVMESDEAVVETAEPLIKEPIATAIAEPESIIQKPVAENVIVNPEPEIIPEPIAATEAFAELTSEESELESVEDLPDFASMSRQDLLKTALKAHKEKELEEAMLIFKAIKPHFDLLYGEEKAQALAKYLEEGGDKDGFEFKPDNSREEFNTAYNELRYRKEEVRKQQEAEKLENLKKKEAILEEIKKLNDSEENANSLKKLKDLQAEWKKIKNVPKDQIDNLWESYRVLNEIFYDRLSINNELKDLDRSKNLDHKIKLIAAVNELTQETSIKKALIGVKKFQEEWRYIGPVSREASDDIWNRFKAEVDAVYTIIKAKTDELDKLREVNLEAKKELLEKAKTLASFKTIKVKEWMEQSLVVNELMEAWKKTGQVPSAMREQVWNEFREYRNAFYANKNTFFKAMHAERNANLKAKEELCKKAEEIAANPIDWAKQTEELKRFQEEWKKIGQAPEKVNDAIWRRFRTACDSFFTKKSERYASQQTEQTANLSAKQALIQQLEDMLAAESPENAFDKLKQIQTEWNAIGFVPVSQKETVNKKYNELLDKLYDKHKQLSRDMREHRDKQNFEQIAGSSNGMQKLIREEKILLERIRGIKKDMETYDNNLGFFKSGNKVNPLAEQIQAKLEIAQKHIAGLEDKLKALRELKNKEKEPVNS